MHSAESHALHQLEKSKSLRGFFAFWTTLAYSSSSAGSSSTFLFSPGSGWTESVRYLSTSDECLFLWLSMGSFLLLNQVATGSTTFSTLGLDASTTASLKGFLNTSVRTILISLFGTSFSSVGQSLKTSSSCSPPTTRPKTECLPSRCWHDFSDTKNW